VASFASRFARPLGTIGEAWGPASGILHHNMSRASARRPTPDFETINALYHPEHVLVTLPTSKLGEAEAVGTAGFKALLEGDGGASVWFWGVITLADGRIGPTEICSEAAEALDAVRRSEAT
jgi:hypothetical protein